MGWMSWKHWSGNVIGARLRVPDSFPRGIAAYGPSRNALIIRAGAIGTVRNILSHEAAKPAYVGFDGHIKPSLAAEVLFRKSENSEVMWKDFHTMHMKNGECMVVICYPLLDALEIEYREI